MSRPQPSQGEALEWADGQASMETEVANEQERFPHGTMQVEVRPLPSSTKKSLTWRSRPFLLYLNQIVSPSHQARQLCHTLLPNLTAATSAFETFLLFQSSTPIDLFRCGPSPKRMSGWPGFSAIFETRHVPTSAQGRLCRRLMESPRRLCCS